MCTTGPSLSNTGAENSLLGGFLGRGRLEHEMKVDSEVES